MKRALRTLYASLTLTRHAPNPHSLTPPKPPTNQNNNSTNSDPEAGMATAEYAIGTLAAAAFAGLLLSIMRSGGPTALLSSIINSALTNP